MVKRSRSPAQPQSADVYECPQPSDRRVLSTTSLIQQLKNFREELGRKQVPPNVWAPDQNADSDDSENPPVMPDSSTLSSICSLAVGQRNKKIKKSQQVCPSSVVAATNVVPELTSVITINVQSLSGALPPISLTSEATVLDLKLHLQTLNSAFAFGRQKLLIHDPEDAEAGVVLLNHRTLKSYQITGSTNVALVMLSSPDIEVCLDDALKDSGAFSALMENRDMHTVAIEVGSICSHQAMLLQLFQMNETIRSIRISGTWTQEHLRFCKELMTIRPDIDIKFVVHAGPMLTIGRIVEFCQLNRCSSIQFAFKQYRKDQHRALAPALHSMSSLQTFELCRYEIGAEGCVALASALQSMSSLQSLELCKNEIGAEGCVALAPVLQSMSSLLTLTIRENWILTSGFAVLVPALQSMTSLQSLDLSLNQIGDEGCRGLALALQSMLSLQSLSIRSNEIGDEGCVALAPVLQTMSSLQILNLYNNQIGAAGCIALAPALQSMSLQSLNFRGNRIGVAGCAALVPALRSMSSLQTLLLGATEIGDEGCVALAPALKSMSSLRTFELCDNHIGDEGCSGLSLALQSMSSLQTLSLNHNRIGDAGCVALAPALQSMSSLQTLSLNHNRIREAGCRALTPALQSMSSLTRLDICSNKIDDEEFAILRSSFSPSHRLVIFGVGGF